MCVGLYGKSSAMTWAAVSARYPNTCLGRAVLDMFARQNITTQIFQPIYIITVVIVASLIDLSRVQCFTERADAEVRDSSVGVRQEVAR